MSNNAAEPKIDVVQLTQSIRERIGRISDAPSAQIERRAERPVAAEVLENLRSIDRDLDSLGSRLESGEPLSAARSLRGRITARLKHRLYRLLWWQSDQFKSLVALIASRGREEKGAIEALSDRAGQQSEDIRRLHESLLECKRQLRESESRLWHIESAQLRLQAADVERNVKSLAQWETALVLLRRDMNEELARRIQTIAARQDETAARVSDLGMQTYETRTALSLQDRRLTVFIEEARKRLPEPFTSDQLGRMANQHDEHRYDPLYLEFENLFRGSRDEIKAKQSVYLPFLKESGIGSREMPILDLGCGRGEWLELLRDHNLQARGVDRNQAMIECSRGAGLEVTEGEALPYLRSLADSSLGCITSFHMVEHLPFETTLALVDEALRVLKPGGVLILETPNPQNILVASQNFYTDPTHLKPLPSHMLRFFVEARGFCNVQIWNLHPYPEAVRFPDDGKGTANRLSDYLYGPQDYAVIGRRP